MTELDALLAPFALWLGLVIVKVIILMTIAGVIALAWKGTTDGGYDP